MKKTSINTFIVSSGERFCLVLDKKTGVPLFHPTLYITTQVRNQSDSISTVELVAGAISLFCNFLFDRNIDIEERLRTGKNLAIHEIDALRDYCERKVRLRKSLPYDIQKARLVNSATRHFRLTHIASYLSWLGERLNLKQSNTSEMVERIKQRRPKIKRRSRRYKQYRSLDEKQIASLLEITMPGSTLNPFKNNVQVRNRIIILILYSLGIRSGELLNIRITDINFRDSSLAIRRRADDKAEPRIKQPLVKTQERKLSLSAPLVKELHNYITNIRRHFKKSRKHEYLFVTHKSGPTQGMPLSSMAYHKIIDSIRNVAPEVNRLTGHKLRHTWNYEFSKKLDAMPDPISEAEQEEMRSSLMGWTQGSKTAQIYNRRFIVNKAQTVALALQEVINKKGDGK
ncbi:tyrosine-type recombinase/integrase [Salmonella enterica]|uniref:Site-specific integrase n=3 Tax=Salmonella enterica TaxID=28901 RepID=A0A8E9ZFS5_SALER|nr:site-specific integrase [Salmonella enterica]EAN4467363.1 site-specific integrase [Salmonella enterica]EAW9712237.1 site-specific integrase [Salmonella enterica]EAW9845476.1 site-specific integrase [Salmonella enterica]EAW9877525.1 site-specific integrase [Salmonella enterica]EAY4930306.1 site-specific integrase [Salmonella enterica]